MKSVQSLSTASSKTFEAPATISLKPPPIDLHKSFDEYDISAKPIVPPKKVNTVLINAKSYSVADLQIATESFSIENLIGEGSIGRVYRAQFDYGKVIVLTHKSHVVRLWKCKYLVEILYLMFKVCSYIRIHGKYTCCFEHSGH